MSNIGYYDNLPQEQPVPPLMVVNGQAFNLKGAAEFLQSVYKDSIPVLATFLRVWTSKLQKKPFKLEHPGVNVYNFYGTKMSTEVGYVWSDLKDYSKVLETEPSAILVDENGDADQPYLDNSSCTTQWQQQVKKSGSGSDSSGFTFVERQFPGESHMSELTCDKFLESVAQVIKGEL